MKSVFPESRAFTRMLGTDGTLDAKRLNHFVNTFGVPHLSMAAGLKYAIDQVAPYESKLGDGGFSQQKEELRQTLELEVNLQLMLDIPELSFVSTLALWRRDLHHCLMLFDALRTRRTEELLPLSTVTGPCGNSPLFAPPVVDPFAGSAVGSDVSDCLAESVSAYGRTLSTHRAASGKGGSPTIPSTAI